MYTSNNPIFRRNINKLRKIANSWVNQDPGKFLLEVGCGDGIITAGFRNKNIFAFDLSEKRIARAKTRAVGHFFVADAQKPLSFENAKFDIVVAVNVLEYLSNIQSTISELKRVLRPDGILVLSFPNKHILGNPFYKDEVNFRTISKSEIKKILKKLNLKIIKTEHIGLGAPNWRIFEALQSLERLLPKQYLMLIKNA